MIQRIQTVYFVLGALALVALLLFDSVWDSAAAETLNWFSPGVAILACVTAALALYAVFQYRYRPQQQKLAWAAQILTVLTALVLYGGLALAGALTVRTAEGGVDPALLGPLVLPAAAFLLFAMARRAIGRDIALVKSMDRLR